MKKFILSFISLPILAFANLQELSKLVVFVANESNPFELAYGPTPGCYAYFRPIYDYLWPSEHAHGSGFIISPEGHVITNAHVVEDCTKVLVVLRTDEIKVCDAIVLGKDTRSDIAVLKIETDEEFPLPFVNLGDSDKVQAGDRVVCIGNPLYDRLENTVTVGVVSATDRNNFYGPIEGYIQTDVALNSGNSGGPLFNSEGEVIGVCCWSLSRRGIEGMNFAIPSNTAKQISKQIIENGKISQGFFGVELEPNEETVFDVYYFDRNEGAWVETVFENSPAEEAGIKSGDLVVELNGRPVRSSYNFRNQLAILEAGSDVQVKVNRDGEILEMEIVLGDDQLSEKHSSLEGPSIAL